jgi:hypothetical protein
VFPQIKNVYYNRSFHCVSFIFRCLIRKKTDWGSVIKYITLVVGSTFRYNRIYKELKGLIDVRHFVGGSGKI